MEFQVNLLGHICTHFGDPLLNSMEVFNDFCEKAARKRKTVDKKENGERGPLGGSVS